MALQIHDLGLIDYAKAWDLQKTLVNEIVQQKKAGKTRIQNHLIVCEHTPVFTLGKFGSLDNLLVNKEILEQKGIAYYHVDRGGDITFHGPGQLVIYPIWNLDNFHLGIKKYVHLLEESIIQLLNIYSIDGTRLNGATGVWLMDNEQGANTRKICAIGIKCSYGVTMHGLAFNVNTDLSYFQLINPCGFINKGVTSMLKEKGKKFNFNEIKQQLIGEINNLLDL